MIGMDIISLGDFCVTHKDRKTIFTFQIPATHTTNYVEETNRIIKRDQQKSLNVAMRKAYNSNKPKKKKKKK